MEKWIADEFYDPGSFQTCVVCYSEMTDHNASQKMQAAGLAMVETW